MTPTTAPSRGLIAHRETRRGFVIDASVARVLDPGRDYVVQVTLQGASASVTVEGQAITGVGFNGAVVDGALGLLARTGTASFDRVRIRTNDPAFADEGDALQVAGGEGAGAAALDEATLTELRSEAGGARIVFADLAGPIVGLARGTTIYLDVDAAGHGWSRIDPHAVLQHELGHVRGLTHEDADERAEMAPTISVAADEAGYGPADVAAATATVDASPSGAISTERPAAIEPAASATEPSVLLQRVFTKPKALRLPRVVAPQKVKKPSLRLRAKGRRAPALRSS